TPRRPTSTLFPYTTLFRSEQLGEHEPVGRRPMSSVAIGDRGTCRQRSSNRSELRLPLQAIGLLIVECGAVDIHGARNVAVGLRRSEEHTSELQSLAYLVCR